MRHPFDDKRGLVTQGGHSQNRHKITFQKTQDLRIFGQISITERVFCIRARPAPLRWQKFVPSCCKLEDIWKRILS
jgi:hypothetical protein